MLRRRVEVRFPKRGIWPERQIFDAARFWDEERCSGSWSARTQAFLRPPLEHGERAVPSFPGRRGHPSAPVSWRLRRAVYGYWRTMPAMWQPAFLLGAALGKVVQKLVLRWRRR